MSPDPSLPYLITAEGTYPIPPSFVPNNMAKTGKYGFQPNLSAVKQLVEVLGLKRESDACKRFLTSFEYITERHLDINETTRSQPDALGVISEELKRKYPEIFDQDDREKRMYFAMRAVVKVHSVARITKGTAVKRKRKGKKAVIPARGDIIDLTLDDRNSERVGSSINASKVSLSSSQLPDREEQNSIASSITSLGHNTEVKREPPARPVSFIFDPDDILEEDTPFVKEFLRTCKPSMEEALDRFINFGCSNKAYMQSLSTWPEESRLKVLRKILAGNSKALESVREMDLVVLENQFQVFSF